MASKRSDLTLNEHIELIESQSRRILGAGVCF